MPDYVEIKIKESLDEKWSDRLGGLQVIHTGDTGTLLSGHLQDQPELHGILDRIRDLRLTLLSVSRISVSNSEKEKK